MKKMLFTFVLLGLSFLSLNAQYRGRQAEEETDSKKGWDHVFLGTGLNLGFSNGFIIGLNPEFGYSINKVLDAGVAINLNYITQRNPGYNTSLRYFALGGGPFVRIWPIQQIFVGGQFEYNKITLKEMSGNTQISKATANAPSLLVGLGYGTRVIGQSQFYTSIMFDAMKDVNSPYRDQFGRILPVFRTGFSFYFGRKDKDR